MTRGCYPISPSHLYTEGVLTLSPGSPFVDPTPVVGCGEESRLLGTVSATKESDLTENGLQSHRSEGEGNPDTSLQWNSHSSETGEFLLSQEVRP